MEIKLFRYGCKRAPKQEQQAGNAEQGQETWKTIVKTSYSAVIFSSRVSGTWQLIEKHG